VASFDYTITSSATDVATVFVTVTDAVCGDAIVSADEPCDDGNADELDGCTTLCVAAPVCDAAAHPGGAGFAVDPVTGHCYAEFSTGAPSWTGAETDCEAIGGYLVTIS
jgi:cysteine-rich repeat protein